VKPSWAKALKILRLARGWNQPQLARAARLSTSAITRYEKGDRQPEEVRRLVAAMGYPPYLWERALAFVAAAEVAGASAPAPGAAGNVLSVRIDAIAGDAGRWVDEVVREALTGVLATARPPAGRSPAVSRQEGAAGGAGAAVGKASLPAPLGKALAMLRVARGWEREDLAAAAGRPEGTIANYEYGKSRPKLPALRELLQAMGFSFAAFESALDFVRLAQESRRLLRAGAVAALSRQVEEIAAAKARRFEELTRRELTDLVDAARLLASREAAPAAWRALAACPEASRLELVRRVAEFQTPGFCELLCQESLAAAGDSAQRARRLAELAAAAAEMVRGTAGFCSRLRGFAGVHVGNALRVEGRDLPAAGVTLDRALVAWEAGAGDDPGLLNAARVHGLTASMRRAQRRLPEALAALDEGLRIDRWGETPALLLAKARALVELGEFEASIEQLQQAVSWIEGEGEPRQLYVVENLLVLNLCHLGQYEAAERRLPRLRQLALRLGNQLDLLRVDWLAGKVAAGRERPDEALALLLRVRGESMTLGNAYDAALATLELAEVHAGLGHTAEVKALARESAPIFEDQKVHREAQRALALFRQAAEEERASGELLRQLIVYLYRARHAPQLRFAPVAA
jgi:transcriptional regulator with XRE-family HTH domain